LTLLLVLVVSVVASSSGQSSADKTPSPTLPLAPDEPLPGMPQVLDLNDIYSETRSDKLSLAVRGFPSRLYVPNGISNTVDVIDPETYQIIDNFPTDEEPQHVVPSYDLRTLWVLNNQGDTLTQIDPATGKKGETVHVEDPYNLYYTPDGKYALVVAERLRRLDFLDPKTMRLQHSLDVLEGMIVAIPKYDMVPRHLALLAFILLLRFGHHRGRLIIFGGDGFFGMLRDHDVSSPSSSWSRYSTLMSAIRSSVSRASSKIARARSSMMLTNSSR